MKQTEGVAQAEVVRWAQSRIAAHPELAFLFHTPNGGHRSPVVGGQMKALGVKRGVPDLLLPLHRWRADGPLETHKHGLAIEMKSSKGSLTPEQRAWLAHLEAQGWITAVCRSAQEAIDALAAYVTGDFDRIKRAVP